MATTRNPAVAKASASSFADSAAGFFNNNNNNSGPSKPSAVFAFFANCFERGKDDDDDESGVGKRFKDDRPRRQGRFIEDSGPVGSSFAWPS